MKTISLIIISLIIFHGCSFKQYTKKQKALATCTYVSNFTDFITTEKLLDRPGSKELNPALGEHPTDTSLALFKIGSIILFTSTAELMPKHRTFIYGLGCVFGTGATLHNLYYF